MVDDILWGMLGFVFLPAWLAAGIFDYWSHRRTDIAHTSGVRESILHVAQALQVGVPVLVVLFLELNLLTLSVIAACALLHTGTAYWDLRYTTGRRFISAGEQMAHAFLITLPVFVTGILGVLAWLAAADTDEQGTLVLPAGLRWRDEPFDPAVIILVLGASLALGLGPALTELRQALRVAAQPPAGH